MPWKIKKMNGKSCVVKKDDDSVVKCYDDPAEAAKQIRALYAKEGVSAGAYVIEEEITFGDAPLPTSPTYNVTINTGGDSQQTAASVTAALNGGTVGMYHLGVGDSTNELFIPDANGTVVSGNTLTNVLNGIRAHAEPTAPPRDHFTDPELPSLQRFTTVTSDGRIYGHLADGGWECHIGHQGTCVTAPQEADYSYFTVGTVLTAEGSAVPTGPIALRGGHAGLDADAASARSHYDDPSSAVADVVVGTDDFGIWFSGSIRPGASLEDIRALRASGVSGDWRQIDGKLRLIGICCVNVPGFPKVAMAASGEEICALVAAGGQPLPDPTLPEAECAECDEKARLASIENFMLDALGEKIGYSVDNEIDRLATRIE